eukprot:SAG31_NODE_7883_length_1574_cov_1.466441_2_plen_185_part_00
MRRSPYRPLIMMALAAMVIQSNRCAATAASLCSRSSGSVLTCTRLVQNNDLRAFRTTRCLLKPGGTLFMTVPIGPDVVVWNLHRRYGRLRLPWLLDGWNVDAAYGWDEGYLDAAADFRRTYEPVFVCKISLALFHYKHLQSISFSVKLTAFSPERVAAAVRSEAAEAGGDELSTQSPSQVKSEL